MKKFDNIKQRDVCYWHTTLRGFKHSFTSAVEAAVIIRLDGSPEAAPPRRAAPVSP